MTQYFYHNPFTDKEKAELAELVANDMFYLLVVITNNIIENSLNCLGNSYKGWKFLFFYNWGSELPVSIEEYKKFLSTKIITDENGYIYTLKEFWEIVEEFQTLQSTENSDQVGGYDFRQEQK